MLTTFSSAAKATANDVHLIIDICTSSQRIMKDYALIAIGTKYHDQKKDMIETIKKLNDELEELKKHKISKALHDEEVALHKEWIEIEIKVLLKPDKKSIYSLYQSIEKFTKHCEVLAKRLAQNTGNAAEHYVVLIAELNMEVQRLAGLYAVMTWDGIDRATYNKREHEIIKEYNDIYNELLSADDKFVPKKIKDMLKNLKKHMIKFEMTLQLSKNKHIPALVAKRTEELYIEIRKILIAEEEAVEKH